MIGSTQINLSIRLWQLRTVTQHAYLCFSLASSACLQVLQDVRLLLLGPDRCHMGFWLLGLAPARWEESWVLRCLGWQQLIAACSMTLLRFPPHRLAKCGTLYGSWWNPSTQIPLPWTPSDGLDQLLSPWNLERNTKQINFRKNFEIILSFSKLQKFFYKFSIIMIIF